MTFPLPTTFPGDMYSPWICTFLEVRYFIRWTAIYTADCTVFTPTSHTATKIKVFSILIGISINLTRRNCKISWRAYTDTFILKWKIKLILTSTWRMFCNTTKGLNLFTEEIQYGHPNKSILVLPTPWFAKEEKD